MWDPQFELFSKHYKVVRYDVRGFGKSDIAKTKFSDHKDLHALLKHLKLERASIMGVSNGGRIALDFAVEFPGMVQSLILVSPGVSGYKSTDLEEKSLWQEFDEQMKPQEIADKEGRAADAVEMDINAWASQTNPESRQRVREIAMDNFHVQADNPWKLSVRPDPPTFERLSSIHVPTLFILGDKDVPAQILMVHNIHSRIPGAKTEMIEGADHIPNVSQPEEFNRVVLDFLKEQMQEIRA
jgi:pimeloyl-ACP methyl ester carboxylesterase